MALLNRSFGTRAVTFCLFLLTFDFLLTYWGLANGSPLDTSLIAQELQTLAREGLGVDEMQQYFNDLHYHEEDIQGHGITQNIAVKLVEKFKKRYAVARQLKEAVEASYGKSLTASPVTECCKSNKSTLTYDARFRSKVDMNKMCVKISGSAPPNPVHLHSDVLNTMRDISNDYPFIKWQYFGSEQGLLTNFPVFDDTAECGVYDPRYRPFYVETATPEPKDVVLVIDTSSSMAGENMAFAVEAANTVLDTMNPKDKVGIVSFNTEASTPGGVGARSLCYSERLALATPINKKSLKDYVKGLVPLRSTFYSLALEEAFSLLKGSFASESGEKRRKVIIFLTDGEPQDNKTRIFEIIKDRNQEMNNSVVILTFGFGTANQEILKAIAHQNGTDYDVPQSTAFGDITVGEYKFVADVKSLRFEMAQYYNFFAVGKQLIDPVVSVPYVDAFGTGLLMSITLPCYHQGAFIGVAGTDINMEDLLSDITYFNQGQSTYAFMISGSGRTLLHPLLPAPSEAYGDPIFMDIRTLETEKEFSDVFESMTKGKTGSKAFVAKRYLPRGGKEMEGVTIKEVHASYYWMPVQGTNFSVGVVIPVSRKNEILNSLVIPKDYRFSYHRIDLDIPQKPCSHFGIYSIKNATVVKLAPGAFLDIYSYQGKEETKANVGLLNAYMTGKRSNPGLRDGIRDTVISTWKVEDLWLRHKTELTQYLVWRYIGTADGVFRVIPGSIYPKAYDPRIRPWYYTGLANTGLIALTTPYLDFGGAGVVITMARTLHRGEAIHKHNTNDEIIGVMGADFPLTYFYRLLTEVYPICRETKMYRCFVMDSAGFLIMHEDFLLSSATPKDVEYVHITEKEENIAEDLIMKKYLIKKQCRNLENIQKQSFYEVELPRGGVDSLGRGDRCEKYQLGEITGTNAFLGIALRETSCAIESCSCFSDNACHYPPLPCECPCASPLEFHYCESQFPNSSLSICPPPAPLIQTSNDPSPSTSGLQKCFDPHCEEKNSSVTCDGVVSCYWCVENKDGLALDKPYCAAAEVCFRGREVSTTTSPSEQNTSRDQKPSSDLQDSGNLSTGAVAGIAVGVTATVFIALIAVFMVRRYVEKLRRTPPVESSPEKKVFSRVISVQRPPAPLPPDVVLRLPLPDSEYDSVDDLLAHRRGSAISEAIQRGRAISVESLGPNRSRKTSAASEGSWPWPYDDMRPVPPSRVLPPLPEKNNTKEEGLDNDGYVECLPPEEDTTTA